MTYFYLFLVLYITSYLIEVVVRLINYRYQSSTQNRSLLRKVLGTSEDNILSRLSYARHRLTMLVVVLSVKSACFLSFVFFGGYGFVEGVMKSYFGSDSVVIVGGAFFAGIYLVKQIGDFFGLFFEEHIDKRHGLSDASVASIVVGGAISGAVNLVLQTAMAVGLITIFQYVSFWWVLIPLYLGAFSLLMRWLVPMMNTKTDHLNRVEDPILLEKIDRVKAMACQQGLPIYQSTGGKSFPGARLEGVLHNRRIVIDKEILTDLPAEEVSAIVAHELGHAFYHHPRKLNLLQLVIVCLLTTVIYPVVQNEPLALSFGFDGLSAYAQLFILIVWWDALKVYNVMVVYGMMRRHEYQADQFSRNCHKHDPGVVCRALLIHSRMAKNLSLPLHHGLYTFLFRNHPTVIHRQLRLGSDEMLCSEGRLEA